MDLARVAENVFPNERSDHGWQLAQNRLRRLLHALDFTSSVTR
jgi:hypothetical protein